MGQFEKYKEVQSEQNRIMANIDFQNDISNKSFLGENELEMGYDAKQLMEHFEDRFANEEDFAMRTQYYFGDDVIGERKAQRYDKIAANRNGMTDAYTRRYGNHYAWKRKRDASKAAYNFREMNARIARFENNKGANKYEEYLKKEEIMKYRLEGMLYAAEAKSKNAEHEKYLKEKARLSCNMVLKDQLVHMIPQENDRRLKAKLESKLRSVEGKITDAYKAVNSVAETTDNMWRRQNGINSRTLAAKQNEYRSRTGIFSSYSTAVLFNLEKFQDYVGETKWPKCVVVKDANQGPINYGEAKRRDFNRDYDLAVQNGDYEVIKECELAAIRRFERIQLPTPQQLNGRGVVNYVIANIRDYYESCKMALPYYLEQVKKEGTVRTYAQRNPAFLKKLQYAIAVNNYIDFVLRSENTIRYKDGKFKIEDSKRYKFKRTEDNRDWHRDNAYGRGREVAEFERLKARYRSYRNPHSFVNLPQIKLEIEDNIIDTGSNNLIIFDLKPRRNEIKKPKKIKFNPGMAEKDYDDEYEEDNDELKININPINNLINNEEDEKEDNKNIIINKEKIIDDKEDDKIINIKEDDNIINIKEDDKKEDINIEVEGKKEDIKIEVEDKKEDVKEENVEEKKEDVKINVEEKKDDIQVEDKKEQEESKNIIIEEKKEEKKEENKEAPKNQIIEDDFLDDGPININNLIQEREKESAKENEKEKKKEEKRQEEFKNKIETTNLNKLDEDEIQLTENEQKEYEKLVADNKGVKFTRKDYLVYKIIRDANEISHNASNQRALKKGVNARAFKDRTTATLSQTAAPLLSPVKVKIVLKKNASNGSSSPHEVGITEKDEELRVANREWVRKWMKPTYEVARNKYIDENLPYIFDDFKWPTKQEIADGTAFQGKRLAEIMDKIRRSRGISPLATNNDHAYALLSDPDFDAKYKAVQDLDIITTTYLRINHNIDIDSNAKKDCDPVLYTKKVYSNKELKAVADLKLESYLKTVEGILEKIRLEEESNPNKIFEEPEEASETEIIDNKKENKIEKEQNLNSINIINEEKEVKKENKHKEQNLNSINIINEEKNSDNIDLSTDKDYVLGKQAEFDRFKEHPVYLDYFQNKVNPLWYAKINKRSIDRGCSYMLKYVHFDKEWNPISETDKANHKWNLDWFKAIEKGKEDPEKIGKMVEEYLPHVYDDIELPPMPREGIEPNDTGIMVYREELDAWFKKLVNSGNLDAFLYKANISTSIDQMKYAVPGIREFFEKNPQLQALDDLVSNLGSYVNEFIKFKYGKPAPNKSMEESRIANFNQLLDLFATQVMMSYPAYKQKPGDQVKVTPYEKSAMKGYDAFLEKEQKSYDLKMAETKRAREERNKAKQQNKIITKETETSEKKKNTKVVDTSKQVTKEAVKGNKKLVKNTTKTVGQLNADFNTYYSNFVDHPEYKRLVKDANGYLLKDLAGETLDRCVMYMLKPVSFDKKHQPVSAEDKKNHQWNISYLKTWQGIEGNLDLMGKLMNEQLPHIYEVDEMPPMPAYPVMLENVAPKEKEKILKDYRVQLDAWCERTLQKGSFEKILFAARKSLSVDNLKRKVPGLREYLNNNQKLTATEDTVAMGLQYLCHYMTYKYGVVEGKGKEDWIKPGSKSSKATMEILTESVFNASMQYHQHKDDKDMVYDTTNLKNMIPEMEMDREYQDLRKTQPKLSRSGYNAYLARKNLYEMKIREPYKSGFAKVKDQFKTIDGAAAESMDRGLSLIMLPVPLDKEGKPDTKASEKHEKWNADWLKAWEDGDEAAQENMIAKAYPHIYDKAKDLPKADASHVKNPQSYAKVLHEWIESKLRSNGLEFIYASRCPLAFDAMKKAFKSISEYNKANKKFTALHNFMAMLGPYLELYFEAEYGVLASANGGPQVLPEGKENEKGARKSMEVYLKMLVSAAAEYHSLEDVSVPFKKMGRTKR